MTAAGRAAGRALHTHAMKRQQLLRATALALAACARPSRAFAPRPSRPNLTRRPAAELLLADAGIIVAAGASQKLVEALLAGDSILSPIAPSDFDELPALFRDSGLWLACWTTAATYRGAFDDAFDERVGARAAFDAASLRTLVELTRLATTRTPIDTLEYGISVVDVVVWLSAWRAFYARRFL